MSAEGRSASLDTNQNKLAGLEVMKFTTLCALRKDTKSKIQTNSAKISTNRKVVKILNFSTFKFTKFTLFIHDGAG